MRSRLIAAIVGLAIAALLAGSAGAAPPKRSVYAGQQPGASGTKKIKFVVKRSHQERLRVVLLELRDNCAGDEATTFGPALLGPVQNGHFHAEGAPHSNTHSALIVIDGTFKSPKKATVTVHSEATDFPVPSGPYTQVCSQDTTFSVHRVK